MIDWEKRYRDLFHKYYTFNLSASTYLDNEIDFINYQIGELELRKKKLLAMKHFQAKERITETEKSKNTLRLKLNGKLPGE